MGSATSNPVLPVAAHRWDRLGELSLDGSPEEARHGHALRPGLAQVRPGGQPGTPMGRLRDELADSEGAVSMVGSRPRARVVRGALINGTAGNATDDDTAIVGQTTAPVLPAVLAVRKYAASVTATHWPRFWEVSKPGVAYRRRSGRTSDSTADTPRPRRAFSAWQPKWAHRPPASGCAVQRVVACDRTHSTIDSVRKAMMGARADEVELLPVLTVNPETLDACGLDWPQTAPGAKISLNGTASIALHGIDAADPDAPVGYIVRDGSAHETIRRVSIKIDSALTVMRAGLAPRAIGRAIGSAADDTGLPRADLDRRAKLPPARFAAFAGGAPLGCADRPGKRALPLDAVDEVAGVVCPMAGANRE